MGKDLENQKYSKNINSDFIVGVDTDGVQTDMHQFNLIEGKKFFKKEPTLPNAYSAREMFGASKIKEIIFGLKVLNKYCTSFPPRKNCVRILKEIKNMDCELHNITARKFVTANGSLGKYYRNLLLKWYKENDIKFDTIQFCSEDNTPRDKYIACSKLGIDVMIEDKKEVALYLAENGIKVILFTAPYNLDLKHKNIIRADNWLEVYEIVKSLKKEKENQIEEEKEFKILNTDERKLLTLSQQVQYLKQYREYLKTLKIDKEQIKENERMFNFFRSVLKVPVSLIFRQKNYGLDNVPYQKGLIFVSNHLDNYDQFIISNAIGSRYLTGLAASTIKDTTRGKLFDKIGAIFVDRNDPESRKNSELELAKRLINGNDILIFPEGTRKLKYKEYNDKEQLEFKKGAVSLAQKTGAPIIPISINYDIKGATVRVGEPIIVKKEDNLENANNKVASTVLTMTRESKRG